MSINLYFIGPHQNTPLFFTQTVGDKYSSSWLFMISNLQKKIWALPEKKNKKICNL